MRTMTSVSGGKTSAYLAANYPTDYNLFALVRIDDQNCRFPDEKIRRAVEYRINAPFVGTIEDDKIIYTMLDLEQFLGREIHWVTGVTYEQAIHKVKGGYLPNHTRRYCTTILKLVPMAQWWLCHIGEPIKVQIGYRANETSRIEDATQKLNANGLSEIRIPVSMKQTKRGWINQNQTVAWQSLSFPLHRDGILKPEIHRFWNGKPVRFADYNNCVCCHHRSELFLGKMWEQHPSKMQWAANQEGKTTWKKKTTLTEIKSWKTPKQLSMSDFSGCDTGFCEII